MTTKHYDVFLSHHSAEKPAVEWLACKLEETGICPFLDQWHLIPGEPIQEALEAALDQSATCAVCIGAAGTGPWANEEMRVALSAASEGFRVSRDFGAAAWRGIRGSRQAAALSLTSALGGFSPFLFCIKTL